MVNVCPDAKNRNARLCIQCGVAPAKRKFCSGKCRQAAHRERVNPPAAREAKMAVKLERFRRKRGGTAMVFDGRLPEHPAGPKKPLIKDRVDARPKAPVHEKDDD